VRQALNEKARTFFVLLNEAYKQDVYAKRWDLTAAAYPNMEKDNQELLSDSLVLPDDVLNDILESEVKDDINTIKDILNGN
jgi:hypothetical protein